MIVKGLIDSINGLCILVHGASLTEENQKDLANLELSVLEELEALLEYELKPIGNEPIV